MMIPSPAAAAPYAAAAALDNSLRPSGSDDSNSLRFFFDSPAHSRRLSATSAKPAVICVGRSSPIVASTK